MLYTLSRLSSQIMQACPRAKADHVESSRFPASRRNAIARNQSFLVVFATSQAIFASSPTACHAVASLKLMHGQGARLSLTICLTFRSYACRSFLNRLYASACAGDSGFTSSSSIWIPSRICLIVMAGFQASSSFRMDRQTVPDG